MSGVEAEKGLLASCIVGPLENTAHCVSKGIVPLSFSDPKHQLVWEAIRSLNDSGSPVEEITVVQKLHDLGHGDFSCGWVNQLVDVIESAHHYKYFADIVLRQSKERSLKECSIGLLDTIDRKGMAWEEKKILLLSLIDGIRDSLTAEHSDSLKERWEASRFDPASPPEKTLPLLSINNIPVTTRGNLTAISAQIKSGKTAYVGAIKAVFMADHLAEKDFLGLEAGPLGENGIIVHLDTEQGREDFYECGMRELKRAGVENLPSWIDSALVRSWTPEEIRKFLPNRLEYLRNEGFNVEMLIVDGVADLANDLNCLEESKELVGQLLSIAEEYQCAVVTVIHQNHGNDGGKATGHLGTQLEKKAETVIKLSKAEEITTVSAPVTRRAPISSSQGPQFAFDIEKGMHVSIESKGKLRQNAHERGHKKVLRKLYDGNWIIQKSRKEIKEALVAELGIKADAAEKIVKQLTGKQWLVMGYGRGYWMLNKFLQVEFKKGSQ